MRRIDLNGTTMINGRTMDTSRIDDVVPVGATELWEVRNVSAIHHNFHIHDVRSTVVDAAGAPVNEPLLAGRKDTVFIPPNSTVRLLVKFGDYSDPTRPYMYHCHLLRHEDDGMMAQFVVVDEPDADRPGGGVEPSPPGAYSDHSG